MDLVLLICLITEPTSCRNESLGAPPAPMACMTAAPAAIAEWSEAHPDWEIRRWRCEPLERRARR